MKILETIKWAAIGIVAHCAAILAGCVVVQGPCQLPDILAAIF